MSYPLNNWIMQESSSPPKINFKVKSHKIIRLNTVEKQSDLAPVESLFLKKSFSKARINSLKTIYPSPQNQKLRKYTEISDELTLPESPKKLSPLKQYETKLKLSAESWLIHDMKLNAYKRGWKPNKNSSFNGLFRILVLLCFCELINQNQKVKKIKVKIDHESLKQSKLKYSKKGSNQLKWIASTKKIHKTFAKGSIVYLIDIIKSMIVSGNQDLFEYGVIFCGYLIRQLKISSSQGLSEAVVIVKDKEQETCADEFCKYCNEFIFPSLGLQNTRASNEEDRYELISTPNQICKLFLKSFNDHPFFRQTIILNSHSFYIKFQVGYNYWQDRMVNIKSQQQERKSEYFCHLVYKGAKNYEALCYNSVLDILMVIEDSKFAMAELDIDVLQKWYQNVTRPIVSEKKNSMFFSPIKPKKSLLPILTITKG